MLPDQGDLLYGGPAIRDFLNTLGSREFSLNHTYQLIAKRHIPVQKIGPKLVIASKRKIRAALGLSEISASEPVRAAGA